MSLCEVHESVVIQHVDVDDDMARNSRADARGAGYPSDSRGHVFAFVGSIA